jgi:hypothetical protein
VCVCVHMHYVCGGESGCVCARVAIIAPEIETIFVILIQGGHCFLTSDVF